MRLVELFAEIRRRDIKLRAEADELRFDSPRGAMTPALKAALTSRKSEIVRFLRTAADDDRHGDRAPILPIQGATDRPLSFAQEQLWYAHQLDPTGHAYNITEATWIGPGLDVDALARALQSLLARHEILRTTYVSGGDAPQQVVCEVSDFTPTIIDRRSCSESAVDDEVHRVLDAEARVPFDLSGDRMLRATLVRLPHGAHAFALTTHHVACDGWSMGILFNELAALYDAYANDREAEIAALSVQYVDFSVWQRERICGPRREQLVAYWRERLVGSSTELSLPTDRPRPATQGFRGARLDFEIPAVTAGGVISIGADAGATPFMTLLAAFTVLLQRYSGQDDMNVGSPVAVYNRGELEPLIGLWLNVLVMRADLSGDPTFQELVADVRETALAAYEHQELPFHQVIEAVRPDRDPSRNPLFQVLFVQQLQTAPSKSLAGCGLEVRPLTLHNPTAKFDLTLSVAAEDDRFACWMEYNVDLFEASTVARMRDHYLQLLEAIRANPALPISRLSMLSAGEIRRCVEDWNDTGVHWPGASTTQALFEEQATRTPEAIAAEHHGITLSYAQLDRRSNRLARHLVDRGVEPGHLVGICVERGTDALVGLLGILKAGAAYVPLDPEYPSERLEFVFRDAEIDLVVAHGSIKHVLPTTLEDSLVLLDEHAPQINTHASTTLAVEVAPEDPAYVLYTSGSTGKPKGAALPHRGLVNLLRSQARAPGIAPRDILLAVTTLSFDIATLEMFLPLIVGARVVIVDRETAMDAFALMEAIEASGATFMQATPSTWRMLYDAGWKGCDHLKVLSGGEALTADLTAFLMGATKELWNQYGPTETTIYSTGGRVTSAEEPISIGRPIANTTIRILDRSGNLVPVGVVGEIHIGGVGLATGYLNRPELTAEKFVADPYSDNPAARLYRTGDLARLSDDGSIAYLGRIDNQVKVRGARIELAEIETVLREQPAINNAVVTRREYGAGDVRLVAYFTPNDSGSPPTGTELRSMLKSKLPNYMVPNVLIPLDTLPMTPNGKLDRSRLPEPDVYRSGPEAAVAEPVSDMELRIAALWKNLLGVDTVSTTDNFFDLGGHSLLSVRLITRIQDDLGVRIGVRDIALQTLAQLAASCEAAVASVQ